MNIIETKVRGFIEDIQHPKQRRKININELEGQLRYQMDDYFDMDGYSLFYDIIVKLQDEEILIPYNKRQLNGKAPSLYLSYWLATKKQVSEWNRLEMMKLGDRFDFSHYDRHPEWQTTAEWERISKLYDFLKDVDVRQIVSLEERSLELFGHEKFLTDAKHFPEGQGFLNRINVNLEDLKIEKYGEPFVFWLKQGIELKNISRVLIVENLSFFHTAVKLLEQNQLDYEPEVIIYGEGNHILSSFPFFFRMFPEQNYLFYYSGDLDPTGYSIYVQLAERYPEYSIQPALKIYRKMLECYEQKNKMVTDQRKQEHVKERFFEWFTEEEKQQLEALWNHDERVPQEVLTIESWRRFHE